MFLLEPSETPYDLRWRMFGISVRVHPMFWLLTTFLGFHLLQQDIAFFLIWVVCVFVSILVHELGHVLMGQVFGAHGHIVLYSLGGLAVGSTHLHRRSQRILVCLAGPFAGFLFLGMLLFLFWIRDPEAFPAFLNLAYSDLGLPRIPLSETVWDRIREMNPLQRVFISEMIFINLMWGILNLLPIWPLDGGQVSRDVCEGIAPDRGLTVSLQISIAVAALFAVHSLLAMRGIYLLPFDSGSIFSVVMFGLLALFSFQALQQAHSQRRWLDDHWHRPDW